MVSLDNSIVPAVVIFLALIVALHYLLFRPLQRVQDERQDRTTGLMAQVRKRLDHHTELFDEYQATIKQARLEGYRHQEEVRSAAMIERAKALDQARKNGEQLLREARESIRQQVHGAKDQLDREAQDMARGIADTLLQRSA
jgi:F-type H+-transporting ATPase subunit b